MTSKNFGARTRISWTVILGLVAALTPAATSGHDPKEQSPHVDQGPAHVHATVPAEYAKQSPAVGL